MAQESSRLRKAGLKTDYLSDALAVKAKLLAGAQVAMDSAAVAPSDYWAVYLDWRATKYEYDLALLELEEAVAQETTP